MRKLLVLAGIAAVLAGLTWAAAATRREAAQSAVDVQAEFEKVRGMRSKPVAKVYKPVWYTVAGAGDPNAAGTYRPQGEHGGAPAYRNERGWWLYQTRTQAWVIARDVADHDRPLTNYCPYVAAPGGPVGRWNVGTAAAPAPTVTERVADDDGSAAFDAQLREGVVRYAPPPQARDMRRLEAARQEAFKARPAAK